jgi:diguanylate cyclase (GGDEF)-like protein
MKNNHNEFKVFYILITCIVTFQFIAYFIQFSNNRLIARDLVHSELLIGSKIFNQLLEARDSQLHQMSEVLSKDYGFRESITSSDQVTIESMLENLGKRANAPLLVLFNRNNGILATIPQSLPHEFLLTQVEKKLDGNKLWIEKVNGNLYHIVSTNVIAPIRIANLNIGYEIDKKFVNDLKKQTNIDVFFISHENDKWYIHSSTLPKETTKKFIQKYSSSANNLDNNYIYTKENAYLVITVKNNITNKNAIFAVLSKPLKVVLQPFQKSEKIQLYLLISTLIITIVSIYFITHRFVAPLNKLAHLDKLTGVGNRLLFEKILNCAFQNLKKNDKKFALLILDLNEFKKINDLYGHDAGDHVLQITAKRLIDSLRASDDIIRLGGDEFAIFIDDCNETNVETIVNKITSSVTEPIVFKNNILGISLSIGVAFAPKNGIDINTLYEYADKAMYSVKAKQNN